MKTETLIDISERGMDMMVYLATPCILQLIVTLPLGLVHEVFTFIGLFAAAAGLFTFLFGLVIHNFFGWLAARRSRRRID